MNVVGNIKVATSVDVSWAQAGTANVVSFEGIIVSHADILYVVKENVTGNALNILIESRHKHITETKLKDVRGCIEAQLDNDSCVYTR